MRLDPKTKKMRLLLLDFGRFGKYLHLLYMYPNHEIDSYGFLVIIRLERVKVGRIRVMLIIHRVTGKTECL